MIPDPARLWARNPDAVAWTASTIADPVVAAFHRSIPGYHPTPMVRLPQLAHLLGVRSVAVKDESDRFGLPAFKVLGASWAANRAISAHRGLPPTASFAELAEQAGGSGLTLVCATEGNHGRAVARIARLLGLAARVHVPAGLPASTAGAIEGEGATVVPTGLVYDDAVRDAAKSTVDQPADVLVQDTAWPGYDEVPAWIVHGYATLFAEIDAQHAVGADVVVVPTGVGSLLQAAIEHYRAPSRTHRPALVAVEPHTAACVTRSLRAGEPVTVDTSTATVMAGMNCGTVSSLAWPVVRAGLDAAIGITDGEALDALARLHELGVAVGPCGAAALAGAQAIAGTAGTAALLRPDTDVVLISTEAAADGPAAIETAVSS